MQLGVVDLSTLSSEWLKVVHKYGTGWRQSYIRKAVHYNGVNPIYKITASGNIWETPEEAWEELAVPKQWDSSHNLTPREQQLRYYAMLPSPLEQGIDAEDMYF